MRLTTCFTCATIKGRVLTTLCLTLVMLLGGSRPASAISGFASGEPAASAQYPDAAETGQQAQPVATLETVMRVTRAVRRDPKLAARLHATETEVARQVAVAHVSAANLDVRQSGSIVLLLTITVVMMAAGVLRWRRGISDT